MKNYVIMALISVGILTGCAVPPPTHLNSNGQTITFANPVLDRTDVERGNFTYVLVEKSIADGKIHLVSISKSRPTIENPMQERIVFNSDLTKFAPDFNDAVFTTYIDTANYNQQTVVMNCTGYPQNKTIDYTPCSSEFALVFVPMGVYKAGAVNNAAAAQVKLWENPNMNLYRLVVSPEYALRTAGIFDHIDQLINAK